MANFISTLQQVYGSNMTPAILERHKANDLEALLALSQDRTDFSDVLPTMTMPVLLFVGESDPRLPGVRRCADAIKGATFFSLPECGHVAALARHDLVLPHVTEFLRQPLRK
jgi:pimeloyl-ACP methyl ester carboxylesterase